MALVSRLVFHLGFCQSAYQCFEVEPQEELVHSLKDMQSEREVRKAGTLLGYIGVEGFFSASRSE